MWGGAKMANTWKESKKKLRRDNSTRHILYVQRKFYLWQCTYTPEHSENQGSSSD